MMISITSALYIVLSRWYFRFLGLEMVYFDVIVSKNLQNSSAIKKISVPLLSVNIANLVCNTL